MPDPDTPEFWELAAVKRDLLELNEKIERLDDWMNGVYAALEDLTVHSLRENPDLAGKLEPVWRQSAEQFALLENEGQAEDLNETVELHEARKKLYRLLELYRIWPDQKT